ncbi:DUF192 domain-containing protein [bacterium]|nr:MAG: DUF192 domain-containing protein [bacterium]
MKRLLPLGLVLAACSPSPEATEPKTTMLDPKPTVAQTTPPPTKVEGNPNRVYQLKDLKRVTLTVKGKPIRAWVMDTEEKNSEGMMFLTDKDVKADEGMLFVFNQPQPRIGDDGNPRGFWMHNTLIPLDIVFMSPKGQVLNIGHGKVQDDTTVAASGEFQYVLEMKAGTAARLGLKAGDTIPVPKL